MKRKNLETVVGKDGTNANATHGKGGNGHPTVPISRLMATPPNKLAGGRRTEGFLSFFARQNPRQIKKIAYSQLHVDQSHNHISKNKNKSQGRKLLDALYIGILGILCAGLSGITIGFHHIFTESKNLASMNRRSIWLPPNDKIPLELRTSVTRSGSLLPLKLAHVPLAPTVTTGTRTTSTMTMPPPPPALEYPKKQQLDNSTSLDTTHNNQINYPPDTLEDEFHSDKNNADFGDVNVRFLTHDGQRRTIYRESWETQGQARTLEQPRDDDVEEYWAFDDWLRNPYVGFVDTTLKDSHKCRRTNWHRKSFPTGNLLHEIDRVNNIPQLIGEGHYREVFVVEHDVLGVEEPFVLKEIHYTHDMDYEKQEYVRVDALVTERMTSNDQIVNIFGYTGFSLIAEMFFDGDIEQAVVGRDHRSKDFTPLQSDDLVVLNNFTGSEKLKLALSMVQPVAALHNHADGVIVHDDIQLSQFLWTDASKTAMKLNDFNRAEVMFWDDENEEYCKYHNGEAAGDWRSPEECKDEPLDEKIDIFSLGNCFFSLLTGYYPFPDIEDDEAIRKKVANGETSVIDQRFYSRSFGENSLIDIILKCWVFNPDERIGINELQGLLEEAVAIDEHLAKTNYTGWHHEQPTDRDSNSNGYSEEQGNLEDSHSDGDETFEEEDHHDESYNDKEETSVEDDHREESHSDNQENFAEEDHHEEGL